MSHIFNYSNNKALYLRYHSSPNHIIFLQTTKTLISNHVFQAR
ncbi:hypothetical protein HanXRQr2_Chr04g0141231 [Helianthus annuus]|nr:hypothetical protein HanXRQr2_Chr04g0141231 [Helianthus annuus]